jgi:hypothetical protein
MTFAKNKLEKYVQGIIVILNFYETKKHPKIRDSFYRFSAKISQCFLKNAVKNVIFLLWPITDLK